MIKKGKKFARNSKRFFLEIGDTVVLYFYKITKTKYIVSHFSRENNFGDLFNIDLLKFFGFRLIYEKDPLKSEMALTGSILQAYPRSFSGFVMGSGFIKEKFNRTQNSWDIRIIRGPLSAKQCGAKENVIFGDPGILAPILFPQTEEKKYSLGIIPHYVDRKFLKNYTFGEDVVIINVRQSPAKVSEEIKQCHHIVSSSLHGLIFADAFRIPNIHLKFGDRLLGGNHKFEDYYLGMEAVHEFLEFHKTITVPTMIAHCKLRYTEEILKLRQEKIITAFQEVLDQKIIVK